MHVYLQMGISATALHRSTGHDFMTRFAGNKKNAGHSVRIEDSGSFMPPDYGI